MGTIRSYRYTVATFPLPYKMKYRTRQTVCGISILVFNTKCTRECRPHFAACGTPDRAIGPVYPTTTVATPSPLKMSLHSQHGQKGPANMWSVIHRQRTANTAWAKTSNHFTLANYRVSSTTCTKPDKALQQFRTPSCFILCFAPWLQRTAPPATLAGWTRW
jgi:hypothetical protein